MGWCGGGGRSLSVCVVCGDHGVCVCLDEREGRRYNLAGTARDANQRLRFGQVCRSGVNVVAATHLRACCLPTRPSNHLPPLLPVQAVCELLAIAGAELEKGAKGKARLDAAFRQVERMSNATKAYASRIRFVMKDVLELRHQHWVARRETFTVRSRHEAA